MISERQRKHIQNWRDKNPERYRTINKTCHKNWYEKNHERIRKERRERYAADPEYRSKDNASRDAHKAKVRAGHVPEPDAIHRTIGGVSVRLYRSSEVTRMIGCSPMSLTHWERDGWLPKAFFDRRRLYTRMQIDLIAFFYSINCHDHDARSEVSKIIFENW